MYWELQVLANLGFPQKMARINCQV